MTQIIERPPMHGDDVPEPRGPMLTTVPRAARPIGVPTSPS